MLFTTVLAFAVAALAAPLEERQLGLCSSGTPQCCATDVLNLADLDCANRKFSLLSIARLHNLPTHMLTPFSSAHHPHRCQQLHRYLHCGGPAGQVLPPAHPRPGSHLL